MGLMQAHDETHELGIHNMSARLGKTFPVGRLVGGWLGGGGRLKIRLKLSIAQILPPANYLQSYSALLG